MAAARIDNLFVVADLVDDDDELLLLLDARQHGVTLPYWKNPNPPVLPVYTALQKCKKFVQAGFCPIFRPLLFHNGTCYNFSGFGISSKRCPTPQNLKEDIGTHIPVDFTKKEVNFNPTYDQLFAPKEDIGTSIPVDFTKKEVNFNPTYDQLFAPKVGPVNPFKTQQALAHRNTTAGYAEPTHFNPFTFENQRKTFHSYGYALDPSTDGDGSKIVGSFDEAKKNEGKTVFETQVARPGDKRKKVRKMDASDIDGFEGPWGKYVDEKTVAVPTEEEKEELDEILAKRSKKGKKQEEKVGEEKSTLHIKDAYDYQDRSFLHIPMDLDVDLKSEDPPEKCYLPKKLLHTWTGHTKGVAAIRLFPKSGHLLLSCGMDSKLKLWEVYNKRRVIRTYLGHKQAVRDASFNNSGDKFISAGYDRYMKIWDTETGECISRFTNNKVPYCVKFNPDEDKQHIFVAGMADKKIVQWDTRANEIVQEYDRHLGAVNTITFIDQNRRFVTTSDDKSIRLWEWDIPVDFKYIAEPNMYPMPSVTLSPNGKWLGFQSMDNQILIYGAQNRLRLNRKKNFKGHMVAGYACQMGFSPDMRVPMLHNCHWSMPYI
ncbi:pre-mRNA-processing factor 17-like [Anneissia japonica]|uniref:pre-mRNA-processing factor 17-like n=1 Tax=Anneissia japonica TaxID=1529436 RepID=UPI0014259667|nr:pre-mRNA-processing factor 17-like [Anneissia japonica]